MKHAKKAFIASLLSVVLCVTMLVGTTYAWFTDSVTSAGNKIIAGTLDIDLYQWDNASTGTEITDSSAPIFGSSTSAIAQNVNADTLWEPGKTQIAYLSLKNNGSLYLKYTVKLIVKNVAKDLYKAMEYAIVPDAKFGTLASSGWSTIKNTAANSVVLMSAAIGDLALGATKTVNTDAQSVVMGPDSEHFFALAIHMQEEAGNEYQAGEVDFDIQVIATQYTEEEDSFDNQYDLNATDPDVANATVTDTTAPLELTTDRTTVTVPASALTANDVYKLVVDNNDTETDDQTGETTVSFDATLYKNNAVISSNGSIVYEIEIEVGSALNITSVKHKGTPVSADTTGADGTYTYDSTTGILKIYTGSFSPFAISYILNYDLLVTKDDTTLRMTLADFRDSVNAGTTYEGYNAKLMRNVTVSDVWTPIGNTEATPFKGSFDGNYCTITGLTDGSSAVEPNNDGTLFGLFGYVQGTVEVKNLTLADVYANMPKASNGVSGLIASANTTGAPTYLTVRNVDVSGTLIGKDRVAGIVGKGAGYLGDNVDGATMAFIDCVNHASIEATSTRAAGICAQEGSKLLSSTYIRCENAGNVLCSGNRYGGVAAGIVSQVMRSWMPSGSDTIFTGTTPNYEVVDLYEQYRDFAAQVITKSVDDAYTFSGLNGFTVTDCKNSGVVKTEYSENDTIVHGIAADVTTAVFEAPSKEDNLPSTTFTVLSNYFLLSSTEIDGYKHPLSYWKWADSRYHVMAGRVYDTEETYLFKYENGMWFTADEYKTGPAGAEGVLDYIESKSGPDYVNTGYCVLQDDFTVTTTSRLSGYYLNLNGHTLTLEAPILYQGGQGSFELKNGTIVLGSSFTTNAQNGYSVKLNESEVSSNARILGSYTGSNATEPFTYGTLTLDHITYKPGTNCVIATHEPSSALTINLIECDIDGRIEAANTRDTYINVTKNNVTTNAGYRNNQTVVISGGSVQQ